MCWRLTIGGVAMISDEQGWANVEILTKQDVRIATGQSARRNESHPAFVAGGHTRIPSDFSRSIR